jgi:succinoglycan biosynthesis transport protein ExoP
MMNEIYTPNASPNGQPGNAQYAQPIVGAATGADNPFRIFWRGRWLILLSLIVAAGGAYIYYVQRITPMYESTSRLLVEKPSAQHGVDVPQPVGSTLGNYLATQAALILSPEVVAAALTDPNVVALATFADPNHMQRVVGTLSAEVNKKVDIIQISASSAHPEDAAQIVNAVVRAYTRWHEVHRQHTTADLLKDLSTQLDSHYRDLQLKRKEQMVFEQRHPEVVENTRESVLSKTLDMLKQELANARLAAAERESYYQGLQRFEKEPEKLRLYISSHQALTTVSADDAERVRLGAELRSTQLQLDAFAAASVATQRSQITLLQKRQAEIEEKIAALDEQYVQNHVALAKTLAEDARTREKQLTDMYEKESTKVQNVTEQDAQYAFLKSECQMMERMCNSLLSQISQLDLNARFEGLKIYVLAKAVPVKSPFLPQILRIIGIALSLGLTVGAGLSFLRDWRDQRIRSQDEITSLLGVPVVGAIPSIPKRAVARGQKLRFAYGSREGEACRGIRTALLCGMRHEEARTILVTSPGPGEGKTLLVSHLAMAMAQAGQRTLILDADLRKPMRQRVFVTEGHGKGLVDVLMGTATLREAIRPAEIAGLDVLESGPSTPNPSELLTTRAFADMIEQLKREYDRILVDSPPVGVVTDAQILASLCDSTLLVLRADESSRVLTQQARDALYAVGARVAGVVVNDVSRWGSKHSYHSAYGCYYCHAGSNGDKTNYMELPADAGSQADNGVLASEKKEGVCESTLQEPPLDAGSRPEKETLPLEVKEYRREPTRTEPLADAGPQPENGALTSHEKNNSRKAISSEIAANGSLHPENKTSAPEKEEDGSRPAGEEPPTAVEPRPVSRDQASENWKKWLGGQR